MSEKIIVIGAGMAGIMAAKTLQDAGETVTLLEARDRVGGRTHTDHSLGTAVDLGAAWIHGPHGNPLTPIARDLGVATGYTDFINESQTAVRAYHHDFTPVEMAAYTRGQQLANAAFYLAEASLLVDRPKNGRSLKDWIEHGLPKPNNLSEDEALGFHYWSVIRTEYGDASDWDLIDWSLSEGYVKLPGGDELVYGGGFNALTDHLATGLDIRLNTAVASISYGGKTITVTSTTGETFSADRLILTIPLGVLKTNAIQFDPPLPEEKTAVINRIGYGNYEKLAMRFDQFYWPQEVQRFNYLSQGEPSLFHAWLNTGHYTGTPIIVAYHAGRRARKINEWPDEQLLDAALTIMRRMFINHGFDHIPPPVDYVRTRWQSDPFSQGSYSFDQVGQQEGDRRKLAESINGRLFFAGEATHPHFHATVHGAYETGVRAAREALDALTSKK